MSSIRRRLLGLCAPPLMLCALDTTLTLFGQSTEYWGGKYGIVNEASPTLNHLLKIHPAAFAIGMAIWGAMFVAIILLLPDALALITSIAVTLGHTMGAATWLLWRFQFGYQAFNLLFTMTAVLLGLGIRYGWGAAPAEPYRLHGWSMPWRWTIALVLVAIAVYLFLWPRQV